LSETCLLQPILIKIEECIAEELAAKDDEERLQQSLQMASEKQQLQKEAIRQRSETLDQLRSRVQSGLGRLASLEALQQAALEPDSSAADSWIHLNELDDNPRLAQSITADPGWETAIELVLGPHLEAVCVSSDSVIERCLKDMPAAQLTLITGSSDNSSAATSTLASKVRGEAPLAELLAGIHVAHDMSEALQVRARLKDGESVVTQDGIWMGKSWLRVARADSQDSVLKREAEIVELKAELQALDAQTQSLNDELDELNQQQDELETRRETQLHAYNDAVRQYSQLSSALAGDRQSLEQGERRLRTLDEELSELTQEREQIVLQREDATERKLEATQQLESFEAERSRMEEEQATLRESLQRAKDQRDSDRDAGQELAIRVESMRSAKVATEQNLVRMQDRINQLTERRTRLNAILATEDEDPLVALEAGLQQHLEAKLTSDNALRGAREQLDAIEHRLREHEQARQRHDVRSQSVREKLQSQRMAAQEVLVRLKTLDEQLAEHEFVVSDILEGLQALEVEADVESWAAELEKIERQIQRLGPINLAAIDELAEQSQRKDYLDEQHLDVTEALATLERAIAKIDRETRSRFKDTFEKVNAKVEEFFPRLFGGGHGSLQMTGDDLLSTGVSVNAQPPGKRVSNIQLLSGGEKALTAVALVFAFFELNPSPFCMLDEVDAPLDDANVGRFCELVKEMSERVQFIFITHNKVTMEMAQQLMGVTMNEPGVSRLVAVDVHEAVELAGV